MYDVVCAGVMQGKMPTDTETLISAVKPGIVFEAGYPDKA
jgi:hypothetical protein